MSIKKTAIYIRVSSDKQAHDGDSIGAQRDALMNYVNSHEDLVFAGEYLDDGISGTKYNRDELQRLLDDVRAGKVNLIIRAYPVTTTQKKTRRRFLRVYVPYLITTGQNPFR